ncbi:uncharacterized protein [Amphiura filiformis]|uniref:uncharacterized protein n=1 Tax=Amphiura filiformis TaxID=82378 RepID=UPI003B21EA02
MSAERSASHDEIERFRNSYLNHVTIGKRHKTMKKRWVVFQGNIESGFYQLKIFKNDSEKVLKTAYTLTKESFVGTERGALQSQRKPELSNPYWAVILSNVSVVFQELEDGGSGMELKDWDEALKEPLPSEGWMVFQITGFTSNELHLTLHITDDCISLATMNPPQCYKQWKLTRLLQYKARESVVCFLISADEEGGTPEYYEVKAETKGLASIIAQTLKRKVRGISITIPPQASLRRTPSDPYERYTVSPTP